MEILQVDRVENSNMVTDILRTFKGVKVDKKKAKDKEYDMYLLTIGDENKIDKIYRENELLRAKKIVVVDNKKLVWKISNIPNVLDIINPKLPKEEIIKVLEEKYDI